MNGKSAARGSSRRRITGFAATTVIGAMAGCGSPQHVIAVTGTVIGVEISQNPQTQLYQAKLGYNRAEVALVPTNLVKDENSKLTASNGAKDTTDVLMELRYGGIFSTGENGGIYQRLAVGENAVKAPGASVMFARTAEAQGEVTRNLVGLTTNRETFEARVDRLVKARADVKTKAAAETDLTKKAELDKLVAHFDDVSKQHGNLRFDELKAAYSNTVEMKKHAEAAVTDLLADPQVKPYLPPAQS